MDRNGTPKKTVVLGASNNPARYSFLAINKLKAYKHPVVAIGRKAGKIGDTNIETITDTPENVDTVTLYLNPTNQQPFYDFILGMKPRRIIFNPGTENPELMRKAREQGIEPVSGCTLVMLSAGMY
jgi:uncharacterized protein